MNSTKEIKREVEIKSIKDLIQEHGLRQLSLDHASYEWGYEEGFIDGLEEALRMFESNTVELKMVE